MSVNALVFSNAFILLNFAMPSLAFQVQKQTHAIDMLNRQGVLSRETSTMWTWADGATETCEDACTAICSTASCNAEAPCSIDSLQSFKDLDMDLSVCQSFSDSSASFGPFKRDNGVCYFGDGSCSYDHCSRTGLDPGAEMVCACMVDLSVCSISEDPHINVFDDAQISLLHIDAVQEDGDKWLVSSDRVKIQARFMKKEDGPSFGHNTLTRAIALGGDILNGNVMVVGSLEDGITWNGQSILSEEESSFSMREGPFFVDATRGSSSLVQDLSQENQGVNIRLQSGVSLVVNRLHRYVNVAIKMPQLAGGQEGLCGNFNGVGTDDAMEIAAKRFDINVTPAESFFAGFSFK